MSENPPKKTNKYLKRIQNFFICSVILVVVSVPLYLFVKANYCKKIFCGNWLKSDCFADVQIYEHVREEKLLGVCSLWSDKSCEIEQRFKACQNK